MTIFNGNHISSRLEVESADLGQIINNTVGGLDLDWNGTIVVAGNVVTGAGAASNPDRTTVFPAKMVVDYVRVYTKP